jgi:hypothetical protein
MVATWKKWPVEKLERILSQAISIFFKSINVLQDSRNRGA